ncbi:MAG TPA: hypothetical protein EYQ60_12750 [Myxococcales bacterium]|nr:hypothetical protein [Myxococcales bacterium]HIK83867.1 hypothetical protein [Myxococcales bacterium]
MLVLLLALSHTGLLVPTADALIFASPEQEPKDLIPDDFPYWLHVSQRRYEGPTVLYLGAGWALTARHVGMGEVILDDEIILPNFGSARTLMNVDGTAADMLVFQLATDAELPNLPILPLAKQPPSVGEELLLIGFGRERAKVIEWNDAGRTRFGFQWSKSGRKRWGTNRVASSFVVLRQNEWTTRALTFFFDPPHSPQTTTFEAVAAVGDSGGAVFVKRDDVWQLMGMMISVSSLAPTPAGTTQYGDTTYAADISHYRSEIIRWTRAQCANGEDDDGDKKIDFPLDPDCQSATDRDERDLRPIAIKNAWMIGLASLFACAFWMIWTRLQRVD